MNDLFRDQLDIDLASFLGIREVAKWRSECPRESEHSEGGLCSTRLAQDVKQE